MCVIVSAFEQWRHYAAHALETIRVLSDHNNLKYFMSTKVLSGK